MKNSYPKIALQNLVLLSLLILHTSQSLAQIVFQRVYGNFTDDAFSKVIKDGTDYYVLGQEGQTATVTRLNANGQHQWTVEPNIACSWNDAVLIPGGDLLVVGWTLPLDATSQSLIGRVTSTGGGNFAWLRSYGAAGRDGYFRIVENPVPEDLAFPYYIVGFQYQPGASATQEDVVLLNLDEDGGFKWKKVFAGTAIDDEYFRDLEVMSSAGNLLLAGNSTSGQIFMTDNAGNMTGGAEIPATPTMVFRDVLQAGTGDIYAVATTSANEVHIMKFDQSLILLWDYEITQLTTVSQVWEGQSGDIYVTGRGNFGLDRGVIVKITDSGVPMVNWVKYLNTGTSFTGGSSWPMPNNEIAFTDARVIPGGFGQNCAFISVSGLDLNTCAVSDDIVDLQIANPIPDSPLIPTMTDEEVPIGTEITIFQSLDWQQAEVCSNDPCIADFTFQINCGVVTFTDQSSVSNTPSWLWTFPGGTPSSSTAQNPVVTYPGCGAYTVCLTVTGTGAGSSCSDTICHTVTIVDNTPPVALCLGVGVVLDANCMYTVTPGVIDGGSFDDCQIQSMSVSPNILTGCGLFPVTLTVTDWCGNTSTCTTMVQTIENVPPVIACPPNLTVTASTPPPCSAMVNGLLPISVSDNCGTPTVSYQITGATVDSGPDDASGTIFNQGISTITYTAMDDCGNMDTCSFTVTVNCAPDSCCTDSLAFIIAAQNVQTLGTLGDCVLSFQADGLTDCMQITYYWGDPSGSSTGPLTGNNVGVSFNYSGSGSGTYYVCYQIDELNGGDTCWSYTHCDSVLVLCESAGCCPEFSLIQLGYILPCPGDSSCLGGVVTHTPIVGGITIVACKNSLQTYYVVPNLPGFTYNWSVVGGTLTSLQGTNPGVITWGSGSQGFIQVIISDATGTCRDTITQKICLIDAPVAAFTVSPGTTVCTNQPVVFTNTSVGANTYSWNFGDGTSSTLAYPPPHSYTTAGMYTVLLTVSNNTGGNSDFHCGCKDTATVVITVLIGTGPTITTPGCKEMFCPLDTATYCVSPGCAPYNWTVNGGTIIATHDSCIVVEWNATAPTTLPAFVSVTTGCGGICGNSATLNVPVLWNAMPISGPTPVCVGTTENYSLPAMPGTFYNWTVSGGGVIVGPNQNTPTITVQWNGPVGPATITCNYHNPYSGCSGSSTLTVDVKNKFTINGPASVCAFNSGVYQTVGGSFGSLANWTISPGIPGTDYTVGATNNVSSITVNWITSGNYTITATASPAIFCNPTSIIHVVVYPTPVINIVGPLVVCPNQLYTYTASSNLSGGNFTWSLAGGTGTVSPYGPGNSNASVNFTGSGPSWTLMATQSVNGCPGSATLSITIEPVPTLPTTPITVCIGGQTVVSVLSGSGPFTWSSSPAASLISGQGTGTATYEIHSNGTITVSNCSGVSNAISVTATTPPVISITPTGSLCAGNLQLCAPANGIAYQWFVNSTATTQCIPVTVPGTYTVQVTFPGGCISVATFTVAPVPIPTVSISTGDPLGWCIPATPSVNLQAFTLSTGCSFQWFEVVLGSIPGATNSTYLATSAGSYYVEVTCGGCVTTSNTITVEQLTCTPTTGNCAGVPNPLGVITASACNPKSFSVSVTGCTGGVVNWNFGDGNIATGSSPTHTYTNAGAYLVTASITCNGCTFLVHTNVNVPVVADFNSSVTCGANGSYAITLNNTSLILGGWNVTSVIWTSSCGTPSGGSGNTYVVNTLSGCSPTVTMVITVTNPATGDICTDTKIFPFNLQTALLSIIGPTTVCKDETYQFNSSMTGPGIVQYEWTVNGTPPVSQDDPLSYAFDGNPTNPVVGLTVTDIFGCTFTASVIINVVMPRPLTIAPVQICPDCLPPASLSAIPVGGFTNYQWYQNGIPVGTNSPTYQLCQFDASGNYYVTATDTQNNNCEVTSNTVQVVYHPKPVADILGQTVQCVSGNGPYTIFQLSNAGGNNFNYTYNWTATGPGAITFSPNNLQHVANAMVTALGTYQFILTVTDITTGCMAKDTFCVYLFPNPMVTVSGPVGVLCEDTPYTFTASATPAANYVYQWSTGTTGPTMTTSQAGYHSVTATNPESGCFGVAYAGYIGPRPSSILFPVGCDTICDTDTIIPPLALGGIWLPSSYTVQWFLNGDYNNPPFFTGPVLNIAATLPPLVYGVNNISVIVTYMGCSDTSNVYNLFIEKCCVCKSELSLSHGGVEYPVFCDPHKGFIPILPCPAGDVIISGYFGFADPITGEPCEETTVIWELVKPDSSTIGGTATNFTTFIFFKDSVNIPGVYCLTLTTISSDGQDTCVCMVKWYREPCDCCTTLEDFCERLENNVTLTVNNALCKATVNIGDLPDCDYLTGINWGDISFSSGPFNSGDMPMHTYTGSGTYIITYTAVEVDTNGLICFEKAISDTITLNCAGCHCGTFSDMFISWGHGGQSQAMSCDAPIFIGCPQPGMGYTFTGLFQCSGNSCADQLIPITWTLTTGSGIYTGVTSASPYFAITLLPTYFSSGGYTLTLTGQCGGQSCTCVISFGNDCPFLCPCTPQDVQALIVAVNKGFSQALSTSSCKACFTPIAVSDCETVEWYLTNTGGTPIGTSTGSNTFCYTFPGSGTYTVIMVVTRKKADGTNCETITKSQTVTVNCLNSPVCINPVIDNPTFSEGAVAGGLNSGGMSRGWNGISGDPEVVEGEPGSLDGWTIQLWGNLDTADILSRMQPICLDKGTGIVTGTTVKGSKSNADNREFPSTLRVFLGRGWSFPPSGFKLNECDGIDCYELASIVLPTTDSAEWLEFQIPYDLSDWDVLDTCGGVLVRPFVYVTNALSNDQGGENTYSYAQLDNFCFNGTLVGVDDPSRGQSIRIYPNPNAGEFTVDLSELTVVGTSLRIIGLTGQLLSEQEIENNSPLQTVNASMLSEGMYILQIISEGRVTAVSKFVKQ